MIKLLFWLSFGILVYTYIGYPLILWLLSRFFTKPIRKGYILPRVSLVLVVYNEEKYLKSKLENILSLDYPKESLEIIVASDGSTDNTNKILNDYRTKYTNFKVIISNERKGKVNMLNKVFPLLTGEIVVFSDARQIFAQDALKKLISNFFDDTVGCVSGELIFEGENESGVAKGVGIYWRYEKLMRKWESNIYSMIGATGAIYAVRKKLLVSPPPNTILDDVFIPLKVVEKGFRVVFEKEARAYDKVATTSEEEFRRKVRTLAGNFQLFVLCKRVLNPFFNSIFAWVLFSHKFLRAIAFFFLIILFVTNFLIGDIFPYNVFFLLQVIFYFLGVVSGLIEKISSKIKLLSLPYVFLVLNLAALVGFLRFIFGKQDVKWEKATSQ
ncbi:MAG: glycosyltransferase family 2 protein [Candidatus Omnitrophica bacterium]|nr:glycosyltransferase family 2 protein [Candidatus Omnitrophota bacterium]MCM8826818.1 glycosyltransferase family 2 protein [Candidatus Omnitrophota bacterium]